MYATGIRLLGEPVSGGARATLVGDQLMRQARQSPVAKVQLVRRSEVRLTPAEEKQFQKAMSDLQPKLWDGRFNHNGAVRRIAAAEILGKNKYSEAVPALTDYLSFGNIYYEKESLWIRILAVRALSAIRSVSGLQFSFRLSFSKYRPNDSNSCSHCHLLHHRADCASVLSKRDCEIGDKYDTHQFDWIAHFCWPRLLGCASTFWCVRYPCSHCHSDQRDLGGDCGGRNANNLSTATMQS